MDIYIRTRNVRLPIDLRRHVEAQLAHLEHLDGRIVDAHVTLRSERKERIADVTVNVPPRHVLKAEERAATFNAAIDLVRDRIAHQLLKMKTRKLVRRKGAEGRPAGPAG
jgi:ribosomal subunit interface protein